MALQLAFALLLAAAIPVIFLVAGISFIKFLRALLDPRYRDFINRRLAVDELPASTRRHFERHTLPMERLGYRLVGDYLLQETPGQSYSRFFFDRDGEVMGAIEHWHSLLFGMRTFTFATVFDNGTFLESGRLRPPSDGGPDESDRLLFRCFPRATMEELEAGHRAAVEEYAATSGHRPVAFSDDQVGDVANYGHRLVWHALYRKGICCEAPPPAASPAAELEEVATH
jgi:hypothetical protein